MPFDPILYVASNPDLAQAGYGNDLAAATRHYQFYGIAEGRPTASFDVRLYIASNPDLLKAGYLGNPVSAALHYIRHGVFEGRQTASFDASNYLASNPDLIRAGYGGNTAALLDHWLKAGFIEGRSSTAFDPLTYVASNPDLISAGYANNLTAARAHWIKFGVAEGRNFNSFDPAEYLAINPMVARQVHGDAKAATIHWVQTGFTSGLKADSSGADSVDAQEGDHVATGAGNDHIRVDVKGNYAHRLIVGQGSSVGAGASLAHPEVDAPGAYFTEQLNNSLGKLGGGSVSFVNKSVNGSTLYDGAQLTKSTILPLRPSIVFDAFGMNDGASAQFFSGETFPGAEGALRARIAELQASGATVVLSTTPHPHTGRVNLTFPDGVPIIYPTYIASPTQAQRDALVADAIVDQPWSGGKVPAVRSYLAINEMIRRVAHDTGSLLVDAEAKWFDALLSHSQDDVFSAGEFVHPNLLGHEVSYQAAIDKLLENFSAEFQDFAQGKATSLSTILAELFVRGSIDGGAGIDTLEIGGAFTVNLHLGYAVSQGVVFAINNIENVVIDAHRGEQPIVIGSDRDEIISVGTMSDGNVGVTFQGGGGNDTLIGSASLDNPDTLIGGDGSDYLHGVQGKDILEGGAGNDVFAFSSILASGSTILDFDERSDKIDVSGLTGTNGSRVAFLGTFSDRMSAESALGGAGSGTLNAAFVSSTHELWLDADHDGHLGAGDLWINLNGISNLLADSAFGTSFFY